MQIATVPAPSIVATPAVAAAQPAPKADKPAPADKPGATQGQLGAQYLGMKWDDAFKLAQADGQPIRVTMEDGQPLFVTADYNPNRINVGIEADVVTQILGLG